MPFKLMTLIKGNDDGIFRDVIDPNMSRTKKMIRLFMDQESAEYFAKNTLKREESEYQVYEVETAYDYDETGGTRVPHLSDTPT